MAAARRAKSSRDVFFVGGTGQAKLCRLILQDAGYSVPIVFDRSKTIEKPFDCDLFHDVGKFEDQARKCASFLVCIAGQFGNVRTEYSERLLGYGLNPVSAVHRTSFIGRTVKVGRGLQVMPHAVVNEFATLGDWCILNTNCTVDHECEVGTGVHIMGGASIAGLVKIGDFATIGTNATILPRIRIGRGAFVGAGAVVTKDVPERAVVVGVPAAAISK